MNGQEIERLIMVRSDTARPLFFLLLSVLSITVASCAVKWEALRWRLQNPEFGVAADTFKHTFQFGNVSLKVDSQMHMSRTLAWDPPFMPFIRVTGPSQFSFPITIDSPLDVTEIDFSKVRIEIPGKEILRVQTVNFFRGSTSKRDRYTGEAELEKINVPIGKDIISNEKKSYYLRFDGLPSDAEEILLNLGQIEIGGKKQEVPVLRYHIEKTRGYNPVNFH